MSGFIGILMLDTAFPRVVGDAGNAESYPFPVRLRVVAGAGSTDIVRGQAPDPDLTAAFIDAARRLEAEGAVGIISTCGFLVHIQSVLAAAVDIPVMVSALSLYPALRLSVGPRPIGILTASRDSLLGGGLHAAGIDPRTVHVAGVQGCAAFADAILSHKSAQPDTLDVDTIAAYCTALSVGMVARDARLGCFLLECGNLPPYAAAIRRATGRPVFDIRDAAALLWRGVRGVRG